MPWEPLITLIIILLVLIAMARNYAADMALTGAVAVFLVLHLFSDAFPSPREVAGVFGNEGLLAVGVLFVVAGGLTETGGLSLLTARFLGRPGSVPRAQIRLMLPVGA